MKHSQPSKEDLLKAEYLKTITHFLCDSTVYDCLSINNLISVVDMSLSLFDVFRIFIDSHVDEVLFWNQDIAYYDGVFTQTDLIKVTLKCYSKVIHGIPNIWTTGNNVTSPIIEIEDEDCFTSPIRKTINGKLTIDQFNQLLHDFKNISMRLWFNSTGEGLHQNCLVQADLGDNLNDICHKLVTENITRIIVTDKETKMVAGIIQQKDILSFLVKGFSQYFAIKKFENKPKAPKEVEMHEQYELEMSYFKDEITQFNYRVSHDTPVYDLFHALIYIYKRNTVPIVDSQDKYLGLIDRRDFLFILKYQMFDILGQSAEYFLRLLKTERSKYLTYYISNQEFFTFQQTLKQVVENLVLSPRSSLVCLTKEQKVAALFQTSDLFNIFLEGDKDLLHSE